MKLLMLLLLILALLAAAAVYLLRRRPLHAVVGAGWQGLLYHDGQFRRVLEPGRHRLPLFGRPQLRMVWLGPVVGQGQVVNVLSRDQFAFRLTLLPLWHVDDPRAAAEAIPHDEAHWLAPAEALGPHLAAAATEVVAGLTLDEFLAGRAAALAAIRARAEGAAPGVVLDDLLLTEIGMPPEVRRMFTEIERARREGQAALERARAEQASLRALANAARMLADNPALAQLRLIQAAEGAKGAKTFVLGPAGPLGSPLAEDGSPR